MGFSKDKDILKKSELIEINTPILVDSSTKEANAIDIVPKALTDEDYEELEIPAYSDFAY